MSAEPSHMGNNMNLNDWVTVILSGLALVVSVVSAYYSNFRLNDDFRVALPMPPFAVIDNKGSLGVSGAQQVTFIDSGNRDVAVTGISLVLYKLRAPPPPPIESQCNEMDKNQVPNLALVYDVEPFILEPGEILVKKFDRTLFPEIWKNSEADPSLKVYVLGGSIFGKGDIVFTCLRLSVTTPDSVIDQVQIPKHYAKIDSVPYDGSGASLVSSSNKPYLVIHTTSTPFND